VLGVIPRRDGIGCLEYGTPVRLRRRKAGRAGAYLDAVARFLGEQSEKLRFVQPERRGVSAVLCGRA